MSNSLGLSLLWFVVILAAIPLVLWVVKRSPHGAALGIRRPAGRIVAALALGPQQRVMTIEVGEGDERRWLVLGVTAQQITALHTLTPGEEATAPTAELPNFATLMKKVRDARK
jgi:flagellar protein FliO/FliZ